MDSYLDNEKNLLESSDFLPIGSVVLLKNSNRKVMIIGVLQYSGADRSKYYEYSGVLYPQGLIDPKNNYLFNKVQIEHIYHLGYVNEEQAALQLRINQIVQEQKT